MKTLILVIVVALGLLAGIAWAACTTTTIYGPGGVVICTRCCDGSGNCTVVCY